ncbi:hypothetical protein [Paraflavitalea speifideaquila]
MVKQIAEIHHGQIAYQQDGQTNVFIFGFPLTGNPMALRCF